MCLGCIFNQISPVQRTHSAHNWQTNPLETSWTGWPLSTSATIIFFTTSALSLSQHHHNQKVMLDKLTLPSIVNIINSNVTMRKLMFNSQALERPGGCLQVDYSTLVSWPAITQLIFIWSPNSTCFHFGQQKTKQESLLHQDPTPITTTLHHQNQNHQKHHIWHLTGWSTAASRLQWPPKPCSGRRWK